jgi:hypothetical protein
LAFNRDKNMSDGNKSVLSPLDSKSEYYAEWKFRMTTLLRAKGCFHAIEENPPDPTNIELSSAFQAADRKAMGLIVKYLSAYAINHVKNSASAKAMWVDLKSVYENRSAANQLHLLNRLLKLKMKGDDEIEHHYARLDNLVSELKLAGVDIGDEQFLCAILLLSMPPTYAPAVTAITMSAKEDLIYENVKLKLKNHNLHLNDAAAETTTSSSVMLVNGDSNAHKRINNFRHTRGRGRQGNFRSQRGRRGPSFGHGGHSNPSRSFKRGHGTSNHQSGMFCTFCKARNHHYKSCRELKRRRNGNSNTHQSTHQTDQPSNNVAQANLVYCQERSTPSANNDFGFIGMLSFQSPNPLPSTFASSPKSKIKKKIPFYNDTGANRFVTIDDSLLTNPRALNPPINIQLYKKNITIQATKVGDIHVITDKGYKILLKNVYYAPEGSCNILSIMLLQSANIQYKIEFFKAYLYYKVGNQETIIASGDSINDVLYKFLFDVQIPDLSPTVMNFSEDELETLHKKLAHLSYSSMKLIFPNIQIPNRLCEVCLKAKQTRKPFNKKKLRPRLTIKLENVHTDVDEQPVVSFLGEKYFLTFIEESTHFLTVFTMKHKSEVLSHYKYYENKMKKIMNRPGISYLYCDNGGEYTSKEFDSYVKSQGTDKKNTIRDTPQLGGLAERMNRTILERACALLLQAGLPKTFWNYAVLTATYIINRSPTSALPNNKTPFEMLTGNKPTYDNFEIFGCVAYSKILPVQSKLDAKSEKCIFLEYTHNGYRLFSLEKPRLIVARDVDFEPTTLFKDLPESEKRKLIEFNPTSLSLPSGPTFFTNNNVKLKLINNNTQVNTSLNNPTENPTPGPSSMPVPRQKSKVEHSYAVPENKQKKITKRSKFVEHSYALPEGKQKKITKTRRAAETFSTIIIPNSDEPLSNIDELDNELNILISNYETNDATVMLVDDSDVPKNYSDIKNFPNSEKWYQAAITELNALKRNKTWVLVDRPKDRNIVGSRFIFKIKCNKNGEVTKYKARLVAQGFSQEYGTDYTETFAPVAKMASLRIILSIAVKYDLLIEQIDVVSAFLQSELEEEIYMKVPEGIMFSGDKVCKLLRSLYGLKQSPRCWNKKLNDYLLKLGFKNSKSDYCVYYLNSNSPRDNFFILVFVDDILLITKDQKRLDTLKAMLYKNFEMTDAEPLHYFLGISIERDQNNLYLSQKNYLEKVLIQFRMNETKKSVLTPLETKIPVHDLIAEGNSEENRFPCRNLIGSLMYVMLCTRPDLCYAVSLLSRYQSRPSKRLWNLMKRILKYVKGTLDIKLTYSKLYSNEPLSTFIKNTTVGRRKMIRNLGDEYQPIVGFADASFATNDPEAHSTTGTLIKLFGNTVLWSSRRQATVALSTMIAEFNALCEITRDIIWIRQFVETLGLKLETPSLVFEDNKGCIDIAKNPSNHKGTRQMSTKLFFVRDELNKSIKVEQIESNNNIADIFTKSLPPAKFQEFRNMLGLY